MIAKEAEIVAYHLKSEMQRTQQTIDSLEEVEDRLQEALKLLHETGWSLAEYYATLFT